MNTDSNLRALAQSKLMDEQKELDLVKRLASNLTSLTEEWASIINRLAHIALEDDPSSNDKDYAEEMIDMVRPYLSGILDND